MKSIFTTMVFVGILISSIYGQQGKYVRKSVSAVMPVYIAANVPDASRLEKSFFEKMVKFYIEVKRFDYNVLPAKTINTFENEVKTVTEFSPSKIAEVMEKTVIKEIIDILNNPEVKEARGKANMSEVDLETFAATKAKSLNLTTEQLKVLMNSAYIYLPFISSLTQKVEKENITYEIKGGILWYHIEMDEDETVTVVQVVAETTEGFGSATIGEKYNYRFGVYSEKVDADKYAQYNAIQAWTKNLGVKTKKVDDFLLTAQIVEYDGSDSYSIPIGSKEGVHLDDGFDIVEYVEDEEGNTTTERIGFARVSKTGVNDSLNTNYTFLEQYFGATSDVGSVVMERPRLGMDVRVKVGFLTGLSIPKEYTNIGLGNILNEDATSAASTNVLFAYNLAPIIGVSQTFYDLEIGFALPLATINPEAEAVTYILSAYTGVSKKLFFGRTNITAGLGFGYDMFSMTGTYSTTSYTYSLSALGVKANVDFEYMWNADLSINVGVGYKFGLAPMNVKLEWDGSEVYSYTGAEVMDLYPDLNLGNLSINVGVNYALSELPFNLFGFLDPLKKY